jgi:hypothetical protein
MTLGSHDLTTLYRECVPDDQVTYIAIVPDLIRGLE